MNAEPARLTACAHTAPPRDPAEQPVNVLPRLTLALTEAKTAPPLPLTLETFAKIDERTAAVVLAQIAPPSDEEVTFEKREPSASTEPLELIAAPVRDENRSVKEQPDTEADCVVAMALPWRGGVERADVHQSVCAAGGFCLR